MKTWFVYFCVLLIAVGLSSCEAIGAIFKGGMWTGAILVLGVIALIIWAISRGLGGNRQG